MSTASEQQNVLTLSFSEQNKYIDKIIDKKINNAMANIITEPVFQLSTADCGLPNAIWIDTQS